MVRCLWSDCLVAFHDHLLVRGSILLANVTLRPGRQSKPLAHACRFLPLGPWSFGAGAGSASQGPASLPEEPSWAVTRSLSRHP